MKAFARVIVIGCLLSAAPLASREADGQAGIAVLDHLEIQVVYGRLRRNAGYANVYVWRNGGPISRYTANRNGRLSLYPASGTYRFYADFIGVNSINTESDTVTWGFVTNVPVKTLYIP